MKEFILRHTRGKLRKLAKDLMELNSAKFVAFYLSVKEFCDEKYKRRMAKETMERNYKSADNF